MFDCFTHVVFLLIVRTQTKVETKKLMFLMEAIKKEKKHNLFQDQGLNIK